MKRITILLSFVLAVVMVFGQNHGIDPQDLQKMQTEKEMQTEIGFSTNPSFKFEPAFNTGKTFNWLNIDAPKTTPQWIHWDSGENYTSIGTGGAANFDVAAKFLPADLADFGGYAITEVKFYPGSAATFTLKIWQGTPPVEVYTQAVTAPTLAAMNIITLDEPVDIDITQDLWVGYNVNATTGYPAGCDAGPQVAGKGNMIYWSGVWQELTALNPALTNNWNIQAYVAMLVDPEAPEAPTSLHAVPAPLGVVYADIFWNNPSKTVNGDDLDELLSIELYVSGVEEPIYTNDSPVIGEQESFGFTGTMEGYYTFTVLGANSAGNGLSSTLNVWLGNDAPAAPSNVILTALGNGGQITWTAPTQGIHGGYINPANTTYNLVRMPGAVAVATGISATSFTDNTVPGIGNYYYAVTSVNDIGVGGTANSNVVLLGAEGILMYEPFTGIAVGQLPAGWSVSGLGTTNWSVQNTANAGGVAPELRFNYSPSFVGLTRLSTHSINTGGHSELRFKYKQYLNDYSVNTGEIAAIDVSFDDGATWTALWEQVIVASIPAGNYEQLIVVPEGVSNIKLGFRFEGNTYNINYWYFDNLVLEPVLEDDLVAVSIAGNTTPSVSFESIYTVSVLNAGTAAQSDYTVKLMREGGIELGSVVGEAIDFGETIQYQFAWTPEEGDEGATFLYGYVDFAADQMTSNNQTGNLNLMVMSSDIIAITIGTGTNYPTVRMPFDFYWKNSFSQTLYYPEELGIGGGAIVSLQYVNNFVTDLPDKQVKIWMGETDATDLTAGWVDFTTLTLVYDGTVDFPTGENSILIPLQTPYIYMGGNLVIYTNRVWENQYFSSNDRFYGTEDPGSNRTRRIAVDGTAPLDPANPGAGTLNNWHPNTTLFFSTAGLGAMEGTVTDGTEPLEGVKVSLVGTMAKTFTDADGYYSFPYLIVDTYDVEFSLFGYYTYTEEGVEILEDEVTTLDVELEAIPTYTVTGTVVGNDGLDVVGALVIFEGYDDYMVETDADGEFTIANVFAGTYALTVTAPGYDLYESEEVIDSDSDLAITLIETIIVPYGLSVDADNVGLGNALFTWNQSELMMLYQHDGSIPEEPNAFYQTQTKVYGTIFDLTAYSDAVVSHIDFHHLQWGLPNASYPFLVHIVDWTTFTIIQTVGPINTLVNDNWENDVMLGSVNVAGYSQVGILIQPLGGSPTDAYPCISADATGPSGLSISAELNNLAGYAINSADVGDFFINLWITTAFGDTKIVKADGLVSENLEPALTRSGLTIPSSEATLTQYGESAEQSSKALLGYNVFLDGDQVATQISETEYLFTELAEGEYVAGVQSVYTTGSSPIVTVPFEINFGVEVTINVTSNGGGSVAGAQLVLENANYSYTAVVGSTGVVFFDNVKKGVYTLNIALAGHNNFVQASINIQDVMTINAVLVEIIDVPFGLLVTTDGLNAGEAQFSWNNVSGWNDSFEGGVMPEGWTQIINNSGTQGGYQCSWYITGTVPFTTPLVPQDGAYQAFMMWSYDHQDEWLITPEFTAPAGDLVFWYYGTNGSPNFDNYYVKVSTDGGSSWDILWNASELPAGTNYYAAPAVIDLSEYAGQSIHIAWNNVDGPTNDGCWFAWAIDNISVGGVKIDVRDLFVASTPTEGINQAARDGQFIAPVTLEGMNYSTRDKAFTGYNVYVDGTLLTAQPITATSYLFTGLSVGNHVAGVQSVYTSGTSSIVTTGFEITGDFITVTFNVDMTNAEGFDPANDVIYITGSMLEWAEPGTAAANQTMTQVGESMIWTKSLVLDAGTYEYKYFKNAGWDGGEWAGGSNRVVEVTETMTVNNIWGIPDAANINVLSNLTVYPNPFNNFITLSNAEMVTRVVITNIIGQVVMDVPMNGSQKTIDTNNLSNGIYLITFQANNGERVIRKMIKQ
jgi:hypothetical protein